MVARKLLVVELGEEFRKNGQRIGDGTAIDAGVQIAHRAGELDLIVVEAPETVGDGRHALAEHGGIGTRSASAVSFSLWFWT